MDDAPRPAAVRRLRDPVEGGVAAAGKDDPAQAHVGHEREASGDRDRPQGRPRALRRSPLVAAADLADRLEQRPVRGSPGAAAVVGHLHAAGDPARSGAERQGGVGEHDARARVAAEAPGGEAGPAGGRDVLQGGPRAFVRAGLGERLHSRRRRLRRSTRSAKTRSEPKRGEPRPRAPAVGRAEEERRRGGRARDRRVGGARGDEDAARVVLVHRDRVDRDAAAAAGIGGVVGEEDAVAVVSDRPSPRCSSPGPAGPCARCGRRRRCGRPPRRRRRRSRASPGRRRRRSAPSRS